MKNVTLGDWVCLFDEAYDGILAIYQVDDIDEDGTVRLADVGDYDIAYLYEDSIDELVSIEDAFRMIFDYYENLKTNVELSIDYMKDARALYRADKQAFLKRY
jgi:hypothetical protein